MAYHMRLNLVSPTLKESLYNDCDSHLCLEHDSIIDTPLTDLEEAIENPLTSSPFVTLSSSSTPRDTTVGD